jgi:hypothetical protein
LTSAAARAGMAQHKVGGSYWKTNQLADFLKRWN